MKVELPNKEDTPLLSLTNGLLTPNKQQQKKYTGWD